MTRKGGEKSRFLILLLALVFAVITASSVSAKDIDCVGGGGLNVGQTYTGDVCTVEISNTALPSGIYSFDGNLTIPEGIILSTLPIDVAYVSGGCRSGGDGGLGSDHGSGRGGAGGDGGSGGCMQTNGESGGDGGGGDGDGGAGGLSGGSLTFKAYKIILDGAISADGEDGSIGGTGESKEGCGTGDTAGGGGGGGGGGHGGNIIINVTFLDGTGNISVLGGKGGKGGPNGMDEDWWWIFWCPHNKGEHGGAGGGGAGGKGGIITVDTFALLGSFVGTGPYKTAGGTYGSGATTTVGVNPGGATDGGKGDLGKTGEYNVDLKEESVAEANCGDGLDNDYDNVIDLDDGGCCSLCISGGGAYHIDGFAATGGDPSLCPDAIDFTWDNTDQIKFCCGNAATGEKYSNTTVFSGCQGNDCVTFENNIEADACCSAANCVFDADDDGVAECYADGDPIDSDDDGFVDSVCIVT